MNNPFPYSDSNKRYYTFDYYLRKTHGTKCYKIPLDGGFTCPNIDGTKSTGGCVYCSAKGSGDFTAGRDRSISEQFAVMREVMHRKWPKARYIAYFQAFTNTYAPLEVLRAKFEEAIAQPDVVALHIATRPDVLPDDVVAYLHELSERIDLTVELGLQSSSDATAERINRGHTFADFVEGYEKLRGIRVCVHLINGLPGEGRETMLQTARDVAALHPHSVKIHLLHVLRNTTLADWYAAGLFDCLTLEEYVDITISQLELLPPDIVIGRLTGDGAEADLIAPLWSKKKVVVLNEINKAMAARNTKQGQRAAPPR